VGARVTITIARQLGSGGSFIGEQIARSLGLKYIDREVLQLCAKDLGVNAADIALREGRLTSFWEKVFGAITFGPPDAPYTPPPLLRRITDRDLFDKQTEIMMRIAEQQDCVIIGRAGGYVLPQHSGSFNIFCHAPLDFRIKRVMELYNAPTPDAARTLIEESDDMRRRYYIEMTGREWTDASNYHVSVDTSLYPLEELANAIVGMINMRRG
jgi:cytidylate kinase